MFTTNTIHYLQKLEGEGVYWFFEIISMLGAIPILTLLIYILITGINFKRGILVANLFFYTVILTVFFKYSFDYPRPLAVDPSLESFGFEVGPDLRHLQPVGFFEGFSDPLLTEIRKSDIAREGFPSGHTSFITALLFGGFLIFRGRRLGILAVVVILLMMLSRMYLARHYLGDVLGGLSLGLLVSFGFHFAYQNISKLNAGQYEWTYFALPLVLLIFSPWLSAFQVGSFVGLNMIYLLIIKQFGQPKFPSSTWRRTLVVLLFFVIGFAGIFIGRRIGMEDNGVLPSLVYALIMLVTFGFSTWLCIQLKLWQKTA